MPADMLSHDLIPLRPAAAAQPNGAPHAALRLPALPDQGASMRFVDLFDLAAIQAIQDSFAAATGVASIITDASGKPITRPSNFCRLCNDIIRATPVGCANCMRSDAILGEPFPSGPRIQPCLSGGLLDGGVSIFAGEQHIANWLIGQVLDEQAHPEQMLAYAHTIGADRDAFRSALDEVTRMPRARFEQIGQALFLIAEQLSTLAAHNITQARLLAERERAEAGLQSFAALAENAPDAFLMDDRSDAITYANPAARALCGYGEALVGMSLAQMLAPDDRPRLAAIVEARDRAQVWQGDLTFLRRDGGSFVGHTSCFRIFGTDGQVLANGVIIHDVTAQREAERTHAALQEQVISAQRLALHELSTPLIPLAQRVVAMPLVGSIDSARAQQVIETLLAGVSEQHAATAIIDITGVPVVDTQVANALLYAAQAVKLLGAQVVLTGIRPEVAQTLVGLGTDLRGMVTRATLADGIAFALGSR